MPPAIGNVYVDSDPESGDEMETEGSAHTSDNEFIDDEEILLCCDGQTGCRVEVPPGRRRCHDCHVDYWGEDSAYVSCRCEEWAACPHTSTFSCDACFYSVERTRTTSRRSEAGDQTDENAMRAVLPVRGQMHLQLAHDGRVAISRRAASEHSEVSNENYVDIEMPARTTEESDGSEDPIENEEARGRRRARILRLFTPDTSEDRYRARQARIQIDHDSIQRTYRTATPIDLQRDANTTVNNESSSVGHQSQIPVVKDSIGAITGGVDAIALEPCEGTREPGKRLGKKTFRLAARRLLVTYAQTRDSWDAQQAIRLFEDLGARLRCGRELHKDGGTHYHFYVDFERRFETENPRRFDVAGAHPNILVVWKTPHHAWDYVGKDGDIVHDTTARPPVESRKHDRDEAYRHVLNATTEVEFYSRLKETDPRSLIVSASAVESCCKRICAEANTEQFTRVPGLKFAWRAFPEVTRWIMANVPYGANAIRDMEGDDPFTVEEESKIFEELELRVAGARRQSLILWGPSRHGKTDLARHIGKHFHAGNDWSLDSILAIGLDNIDYGILDDIDWDHALLKGSRYKAWLGCQEHFICSDKYTRKYNMKWGKPIIYLSNNDPVEGLKNREMDWIRENCIIQEITLGGHICRRPDIFERTVASQPQEAEAST